MPLGIFAAIVGPALALSIVTGSINIAHNDDWGYRRPALSLYEHGHFVLVGWAEVTLFTQVLWAWPFWLLSGRHQWAFACSTEVACLLGTIALFGLARRLLSPRRAALVVLVSLLVPGFALSSSTFMTDVPAWSASMVCLWAGDRALREEGRRRNLWYAAALVVGVAGFGIRETVVAALVAVIATTWLSRRHWRGATLGGIAALVSCGVIYELWRRLPDGSAFNPAAPSLDAAGRSLGQMCATLSLFLLPITASVILESGSRILGRATGRVGALVGGLIAVADWSSLVRNPGNGPFLGNYLTQSGVTANIVLNGQRSVVFPSSVWHVIEAAGLVGLVPLGAVAGDVVGWLFRRPFVTTVVLGGTFLASYTGGLVILVLTGQGLFDRYLWSLVPVVALLGLIHGRESEPMSASSPRRGRRGRRGRRVAGSAVTGVLFGGIALVAAALTANADVFDAARWHAGERLVTAGLLPGTVDAGLEWVGMHQRGRVGATRPGAPGWYDWMFSGMKVCGVVTSSPMTFDAASDTSTGVPIALRSAGAQRYSTWWLAGSGTLDLYRFAGGHCARESANFLAGG